MMKEFWDERYAEKEYVYGEGPNLFFKSQISSIPPGKLLLPAEGEGRNAAFAAGLGWEVTAFDLSKEGKKKAESLARKNEVTFNYQIGSLDEIQFPDNSFDVIALIYAHFPSEKKSAYHKKLIQNLKAGGIMIFEAFSKNQIRFQAENPLAGGPKKLEMLFSIEEIQSDFEKFETIILREEEVELREGKYHQGSASVIRFVGKK